MAHSASPSRPLHSIGRAVRRGLPSDERAEAYSRSVAGYGPRLAHPAISMRDTALFMSFRRRLGYRPNYVVPLATLVKQFTGRDIEQNGGVPVRIGARVKDACCTVGDDQVWSPHASGKEYVDNYIIQDLLINQVQREGCPA